MIRILVVDDNNTKKESISAVLEELSIPSEFIECVASAFDAKKALSERQYDVLLLDLILPERTGEDLSPNAGANLLRELISLKLYKLPHWVFILSEYDAAIEGLEKTVNEMPYAIIKYDAASDEWTTRLKNYLAQVLRTESESIKTYDYDAAILCALETPELEEVKQLPFEWSAYNILGDSTDYFVGSYREKKIVCAAAYEMGMSSAAILATKMICTFHPRYLIMTGIAGSADKENLHFGDIMVADPCFDYESGKKEYLNNKSEFRPDYHQIRMDDAACQLMRRLAKRRDILNKIWTDCVYDKPDNSLQIKIGPFGSGASVLSDPTIIASVKEHNRKFLGFDMEAYAVMLAGNISSTPKVTPIVIKSVSDFGDGKTDQFQKYAAYTSARILYYYLAELFAEK